MVTSASSEDIHTAYKRLARRAHPDAGGDATLMSAINEAYRVLSDPGRRAMYDAGQRGPVITSSSGFAGGHGHAAPLEALDDDGDVDFVPMAGWQRRLPAWALLVLGSLFAVFLFTAYASSGRGTTTTTLPPVDGALAIGSCVHELPDAMVEEIGCGGRRDGVVMALVRVGERCPAGTERLGRVDTTTGFACITRS